MSLESDYMMFKVILIISISLIIIGVISVVFAEEVSCQFLESNNLGVYFVSRVPSGEYELRPDYYTQRIQCIIDKEINNNVQEEEKGWFNW